MITILTLDELQQLRTKYNLTVDQPISRKIVKFSDNNNSVWFSFDEKTQTFDVMAHSDDDMCQKIYHLDDSEILEILGISEEDIYISGWECTIRDAGENPGSVYHYTTEEAWEKIQKTGKMIGSYGTGLTNRGAHGIFCSVDPDVYADGTYGNICLEINLSEFKKDHNLPKLDLIPEPEILENELKNVLVHKLGLDNCEHESSSDMSGFTIIVQHQIPLKYIKEYGN